MKRMKKGYASILALMMAIVMTTVFMMPDLGISVKAGGFINILSKTYYNTNPPKIVIKYQDPSGETKVRVCVVSMTDNGSNLGRVNMDGQTYYINSEGTTDATVEKDNGDGTKDMSAEVILSSGSGSKLPEGTAAKLYVEVKHGDQVVGKSIFGSPRNDDITIPAEEGSPEKSLTATPPIGETKYYNNGLQQQGVAEGTGYTLSGAYRAINAGTYTATATLQSGYKWTDGTTAAKEISWQLKPAEISGVTVKVEGAKDFTYTSDENASLVLDVTFANGSALKNEMAYSWSAKGTEGHYGSASTIRIAQHKAGDYSVSVAGSGNVTGMATADYTITKNAGKFKAKAKKKTYKVTKQEKKKKTVDISEVIATENGDKVTYKKVQGNKYITIDNKNGKVVLKKKLKPGTYKVKVQVTSTSENYTYGKATQMVEVKLKVKRKK
ncbi:hypothetical protein [Butyrivibrio sp. WCD2001]|uniref:hypothetical protein n=1 Tax=Butyrivibrio sp. WCD2001 TaxID=1280681 RepID=UPI0003FC4848|nr:hypothetical protein [Butyrivibrio sp. WCD2001]